MFIKSLFVNILEQNSVSLMANCLSAYVSAEIQNRRSKSSLLSEEFGRELELSLESEFLGLSPRRTGSSPPARYRSARQRNPEMNP
jgi:hypothetical protein